MDNVMLMGELLEETGIGGPYGRDIHSVFNSLRREKMYEILGGLSEIWGWVNSFLRPRTFGVYVDSRGMGRAKMIEETSQGSLSPIRLTL